MCEQLAKDLDFGSVVVERSAVAKRPVVQTGLTSDRFNQLPDRHTGRYRVRVHDDVRAQSVLGERHIGLGYNKSHRTLLAVAARHLITQVRNTDLPDPYLGNPEPLFAVRNKRFIDDT